MFIKALKDSHLPFQIHPEPHPTLGTVPRSAFVSLGQCRLGPAHVSEAPTECVLLTLDINSLLTHSGSSQGILETLT